MAAMRLLGGVLFAINPVVAAVYPFNDTALSIDERVSDLVSRLTCAEKIAQTGDRAPAIPRLGIKRYFYRNEACHGVMTPGATVFPQVIGLSATWDTGLVYSIASAVSDEARAFNVRDGNGLTFWSPTVNMARDPRWGRNEECWGEDVYLAKKMTLQFIKGMQGDHPRYLKTVATVKHFACNNAENNRCAASSNVDERSLREYYLPVFKAAVTQGNVASVMSAYNALNGVPCSGNKMLLTDILRKEWGFKGYVVSDCDAIVYMNTYQHYVATNPQAAVIGCEAGCDLNCGETYQNYIPIALQTSLWSFNESFLDTAVKRILRSRFLLGEFDPPGCVPYAVISATVIGNSRHQDISLTAARESIVLLKNNGILPLDTAAVQTVAVIGPNANRCVLGGYSAEPAVVTTPLRGIVEKIGALSGKKITYIQGCSISGPKDQGEFDRAVTAAANADVAVMVMGTDTTVIGEDRDQWSVRLPGVQDELVAAVYFANPRTVVVLVNGNPLAVNWIQRHIPALVEAWYGGPFQGRAIAEVLFGDYNPGGKLTQTWVTADSELPSMNDYSIAKNRTYMYFAGAPLYPFGYGLSFTSFDYGDLSVVPSVLGPGDTAHVSVAITNTGGRAGDEVAQLYIHSAGPGEPTPLKQLKGFCRVSLQSNETKTVAFTIPYDEFSYWDTRAHSSMAPDGVFDIMIGPSSQQIALSGRITTTAPGQPSLFPSANNMHVISIASAGKYLLQLGEGRYHTDIVKPDGRVVYAVSGWGPRTLAITSLPPGFYIVRTTREKNQWLSKFLVPR